MKKTVVKKSVILLSVVFFSACASKTTKTSNTQTYTLSTNNYPIVATGQTHFFDNQNQIEKPKKGDAFYGQDAQFIKNKASYTDNGDGTVTDNITGLIWQKSYKSMSYSEAVNALKEFKLAGYTDWRIPTIKEAYSLINFGGADPSALVANHKPVGAIPFINTQYFDFDYASNGHRVIDVQLLTSTFYQGEALGSDQVMFGVNVADGRIKGYPIEMPGRKAEYTVRFVRGNKEYGKNNFKDNNNGTISDLSTGLMWQKEDSSKSMNWQEALEYAQEKNKENYLGFSDWRVPNAKELQSLVDYNRSPQKTNSAAISPLFNVSTITNELGKKDYPFYWTSTTHKNAERNSFAIYVAFGEALGYFAPPHSSVAKQLMDVHGAGAQRSDPKAGDPLTYEQGKGPQGDVIRINNYTRLVRDID